jgi:hypothetical protein
MTDEQLIARLQTMASNINGWHGAIAADRIEALTKERDGAREYAGEVRIREKVADDARIKAETKLAKAVEALQFYAWENQARLPSDGPWGAGSTDFGKIARAALAEIKGDSHD